MIWTIALLILSLSAAPAALRAQSHDGDVERAQADSIVSLESGRVALRVIAWRDFMPRRDGSREGSDLMVNLQIVGLGSAPLSPGLVVDSAWLRSSQGLWASTPTDESRPELPHGLDLMLRGGPRWAPGQEVDIMLRPRLPSGPTRYLQVRRQPIGRTE